MNEQLPYAQPRQLRTRVTTIFVIVGLIFLAASLFIIVFRVGQEPGLGTTIQSLPHHGESASTPAVLVIIAPFAYPGTLFGLMLFLIGLVNFTKKPSLHWLRVSVTILCGILIGLSVLAALLLAVLGILFY